ncbi:MAG: arylformamidase [Pseudomonadota bacterium]
MTPTLIDISPPLTAQTPVFPGDTAFRSKRTWVLAGDCPVNVSRIELTTHAGAHADAPLHYDNAGAPIDAVDLEPYIGPCAVIHVIKDAALLRAADVSAALEEHAGALPSRVLIRTYNRQPSDWDPRYAAISAEAIEFLAGKDVRLIGVDTPSLDPASSKIMDAHKAVYRNDMRILEGLLLDHVAPGQYELIAPPLKLAGLDAAPVRAVLRTLP